MRLIRSVLWYSPVLPSMERCSFLEGNNQKRLEGTVLTLMSAGPAEIRYVVTCSAQWRTRRCTVHIECAGATKRIDLEVNNQGAWLRNGMQVDEFEGISDVDLGFSPSTNTLPVRRLALEMGQVARIPVVWLRFPELDIFRTEQVYTREKGNAYRFETGAGDFRTRLEVDESGIITRYGNIWRELRTSEEKKIRSEIVLPR